MTIPHYIGEALEDFRETLKVNVVNPETSQLFNITNKAKDLDEKKKESYHSTTANILCIMKQSRP